MAMAEFYSDAAKARIGELKVLEVLSSKTNLYTFEHLTDYRTYGKKGDIRAIEKESGKAYYIEVKNDDVINRSRNVLCESLKYFYDSGYRLGSMKNDYEFYAIHNAESRTIYVIDFNLLRSFYTKGKPVQIDHNEDITYGYLVSLDEVRHQNALLYTIEY